jgi:hypothetical protein
VATRLVNTYPADVIMVFAGSATGYLLITIPSGLLLGVVERRVVVLR